MEQVYKVNSDIKKANRQYLTTKVNSVRSHQRKLFSVFPQLTQSMKVTILTDNPPNELPEMFATYFCDKIENLRQNVDYIVLAAQESSEPESILFWNLDYFEGTSAVELKNVLKRLC